MTIQTYPAPKSQVTSNFWRYTAVGGETSLSGVDNSGTSLYYYPNQEQVYLNGILLVRGVDYTATSGTSIVGLATLNAGDSIQVNCYSNFTITQVPATSLQGSITNLQLANSTITIGGQTINLGGSQSTFSGITLTSPTINNQIAGTGYSTSVPLTVKGASGQTSNLQEWKDSYNNTLSSIDSAGVIRASQGLYSVDEPNVVANNTSFNIIRTVAGAGLSGAKGASNNQIDLILNSVSTAGTPTEAMRIASSGNISIGGLTPDTYNPNTSYNKILDIRQSDQVLTLGSYWQAGVGQNSYINSSQSTSATNASNLIIQTGRTEAMRVDTSQNVMVGTTTPVGKFTVAGALSTTTFSPDQTLNLTSATTYAANTAYTLGNINVSASSTFICQLIISMDNTGYHHYVGTFLLPMVFWKASGTTFTYNFVMEQHNGNNANATITLPVGYSVNRPITFQTDQSITVASGGAVTLYVKRIF